MSESEAEAGTSNVSEPDSSPPSVGSAGPHSCELCGKMFQFRYQLIVHR